MYCQNCGAESNGNVCANCGTKLQNANVQPAKKKTVFKKWWFWVIIVIAFAVIVSALGGDNENGGNSIIQGEVSVDSPNVVEDVAEYEINRVFVADKIEALLDGFITYNPQSGNEFIIVDMDVKNLTAQYSEVSSLINVSLKIDGTSYNTQGYIIHDGDVDAYGGVDALEQARIYFAAEVAQGTSAENMTMTVNCGGKTSSCVVSVSQYEAKKEYLTAGKEYTDNSTMSVTMEKTFFTNRLEPPKINGVYSYYEAENGKTYLTAKFNVKNLKGTSLDIDDIAGVKAIYDGKYKYDGFVCIETDNGSDLDGYGEIEPLDSTYAYYLIEVPAEVENGPVELEVYLLGETYYYTVK